MWKKGRLSCPMAVYSGIRVTVLEPKDYPHITYKYNRKSTVIRMVMILCPVLARILGLMTAIGLHGPLVFP
jgi:hypothetical protein